MKTKKIETALFNQETINDVRHQITRSLLGLTFLVFVVTVFIDVRLAVMLACLFLVFLPVVSWPLAIIRLAMQIRKWAAAGKNVHLVEAIKKNRMFDVWLLLWAGADVNNREMDIHGDPWDDWRGWTYKFAHPLDYAKSEEVKKLLIKHGAQPCPDKNVYCF